MSDYPSLHGVATADLIEKIGTGKFTASYINWSRTMALLRTHAPNWLPYLELSPDEQSYVHRAPVGGYLMIGFRHIDGRKTDAVPQAIMDHRNNAIPFDEITARDITDTHRRGICLASAMLFGLAYELWAKFDLEDPYKNSQNEQADRQLADEALERLATMTDINACRKLYASLSPAVQKLTFSEFKEKSTTLLHGEQQ